MTRTELNKIKKLARSIETRARKSLIGEGKIKPYTFHDVWTIIRQAYTICDIIDDKKF